MSDSTTFIVKYDISGNLSVDSYLPHNMRQL
ncbi:MAG: hypothetical protein A4E49_03014 [Methanosaeta sp. PtaU1.Bin112]|nr:MAG: hypothetical protein A4E49_03014 [Methanosaeta sp. PtaU1.Bin112]